MPHDDVDDPGNVVPLRSELDDAETWVPDDAEGEDQPFTATPFVWPDPSKLPRRQFLYRGHLIRKFVSATVAAGGVGKTALTIAEAVEMATGRAFIRDREQERLNVWQINLEDPYDELQRRIVAVVLHYGIDPAELEGRLFVDSGRDRPLCLAEETQNGARVVWPVVDAVVAELKERKIDVLRVDPFISSHGVSENDNRGIDAVVKAWGRIADAANCAVELVHHVRKQQAGAEVTADSARGAKALVDAARSVRVMARMTEDEGERAGVENHRLFARLAIDKGNLAPPPEKAEWVQMVNFDLPNGDSVGVVEPWSWPDPFDHITPEDVKRVQNAVANGEWLRAPQAKDKWVGHAIAQALELDLSEARDKTVVGALLKTWLKSGILEVVTRSDQHRNSRKFVEVGEWIET